MGKIKVTDRHGNYLYTAELVLSKTKIDDKGRPFRLSGTRKNSQLPSKWIDKTERWHWIHSFKYLDEQGGFFEIEIGYNNEFIKLEKV